MEPLSGPALLLLLVLLNRQLDQIVGPNEWRRAPQALRDLANWGRLLVDDGAVKELPVTDNTRRGAVDELKGLGLIAEVHTRGSRFIALLDHELLTRASEAPGRKGRR